jgi:glyoxylase-like metal-dependent hydrolase (beta-lactamase superfamily II)
MLVAHAVLDRSGAFVLASDAVPVSRCLTERYAPRNTANVEAFMNSLDEIARLQKAGATVLCGHDDAQWRTMAKGAEVYD